MSSTTMTTGPAAAVSISRPASRSKSATRSPTGTVPTGTGPLTGTGSVTTSVPNSCRHSQYGGALPGASDRAQSTCTPPDSAASDSASSSRVLPIPASPEHTTTCGRPLTASANQPRSRANSAERPNNAVTASKPTDGSSARYAFGDHCNEPAVVETPRPQRAGTPAGP